MSQKEMKIDVAVCTKEKTLPERWLKQLKHIPLNNLIVETSKPLAMARMRAIQKVETEYFAFIDDDVYTCPGWFEEITQHLEPSIGAISGREQLRGIGKKWEDAINRYLWAKGKYYLTPGERGTTVDTLIKTDLVKDWEPSRADLRSWEDYELTQHILRKGYRWMLVNAHADHYGWTWRMVPAKTSWHAEGMKQINPPGRYYIPRWMLKLCAVPIVYLWRGLFTSVGAGALGRSRARHPYNLRVATFLTWQDIWWIIGMLKRL